MSQAVFSIRLMPSVPAEIEWKYLVNETYIGERCIVPLLQEIVRDPRVTGSLQEQIKRQIDEEVEHVRLYFRLIGVERLPGSGYDAMFSKYVRELPNITLKLYSLQAMLEGIALGALNFRLKYLELSPSSSVDIRAHREEEEHVRFSFPFFSQLLKSEGVVSITKFRKVTRDINSIFVEHFSGETLKQFVHHTWESIEETASEINASSALRKFREQSSITLVKNKNLFLQHYFESARQ